MAGEITCPGNLSADGVGMRAYNNGGGIEFGGIYNVPVVANFYIEPGLKLYYNTYSMNEDFVDLVVDNSWDIEGISNKKFGMRIPVMAVSNSRTTTALLCTRQSLRGCYSQTRQSLHCALFG